MFSYLMTAFTALLFVVLTPGVLLTLPSKASGKIVIALVHGLIFALVYHFTHKAVWAWTRKYEAFQDTKVCVEFDEAGNCMEWVEGFQTQCENEDEEGNCLD